MKAVLPQNVRNDPSPCQCGQAVSCYTTTVVGEEFKFWPQSCEQCRVKAYREHLDEDARNAYQSRSGRCSGHQNRKITHGGVEIGLDDYRRIPSQADLCNYMVSLLRGQSSVGAYIYGPTGTGKTFLMKVLNNELINRNRDVCFIKAVDLALVLRKETFGDNYKGVLNELRNVEILIVDDYGTQKNTDFVKEAIFSIFDYRYDNAKTTIITSNLTSEDLDEADKRLSSRINDKNWMADLLVKSRDIRQIARWEDF